MTDVSLTTPILCIVGPTASGKTALSLALAHRLGGAEKVEIISADAMQLYRGMDIGTAKVSVAERNRIPHHQLDVLDVTAEASVSAYQKYARENLVDIVQRGKIPLVVGGSGLYVSALLEELNFPGTDVNIRAELNATYEKNGLEPLVKQLKEKDPKTASLINLDNPRRVIRALEVLRITGSSYTPTLPRHTTHYQNVQYVGVTYDKPLLNKRIELRTQKMFNAGLLEETRELVKQGLLTSPTASKATGYMQAAAVLAGTQSVQDAIENTAFSTRRLAKKQRTWFRGNNRIIWHDLTADTASNAEKNISACADLVARSYLENAETLS